jgi:hypothetical protein
MDLFAPILGEYAIRKIRERATAAVLTIGRDRFTRADLSRVECFNFTAAHLLTTKIRSFDVASTADVFRSLSPRDLAIPGLGAVSLATLGAAFESKGVGTLSAWVAKHRAPDTKHDVTFGTLKSNSLDEQAAREERRAAKSRKATRRDKAHRIRVDRYERRVSTTANETDTTH